MDFIQVKAKTVEEAITEASIQLETSSDHIEYHVIQKGSSGFLGIGSKPAIIEARKKEETDFDLNFEDLKKEPLKVNEPKEKEEKKKSPRPVKNKKPVKSAGKETAPGKEVPEASVKEQEKVLEKEAEKAPVKETVKKAPANKEEVIERVNSFLNDTCKAMGIEAKINAVFEGEDTLNVDLVGSEMGILIGKRGRTLDSLQYLTSLVANKGNCAYIRVKVDTEDYRRRRKETLENMANNIAVKVRRTRKTVFLEPMNPYERRIIHSALQNNPYVSTHSEGEEPYRKVVVTLKKQ